MSMALISPAMWRYNYRIITGVGLWILVLPVAATQIVTLWMFVLQHEFSSRIVATVAELMTPLTGAFLCAHALSPEYRSGISAVLASKPVSLLRVAALRVVLALAVAFGLTVTTLIVCSMLLRPVDLERPLLAALPSLWFLSMVALTFATLFRSSLGGFAVAAALWALDVRAGHTANPLFSLQGLSAVEDAQPLAHLWLINKAVLVVAGLLLLVWHGRLLRRLGRTADRADLTRVVLASSLLIVLYVVSGAAVGVSYAWTNRGNLKNRDVTWLRRQMTVYAPLPVSPLFGMPFTEYVAPFANKEARVRQLESALRRWPGSIWADSMAQDLAVEQVTVDPAASAKASFQVADQYPTSPFAPIALGDILEIEEGTIPEEDRLRAARQLVREYPATIDVDKAGAYLESVHPETVQTEELLAAAERLAELAPNIIRPRWLATAAGLHEKAGRREEAARMAKAAVDLGQTVLEQDIESESPTQVGRYRTQIQQSIGIAQAIVERTARQ